MPIVETSYITNDELERYGLNRRALERFSEADKSAAGVAASSEANTWISRVVGVPLVDPPIAFKVHVARIAVYNLACVRGIDPEDDKILIDNYKLATAYLTAVSKGMVVLGPDVLPPADNPVSMDDGPSIGSDEPRGFSRYGI